MPSRGSVVTESMRCLRLLAVTRKRDGLGFEAERASVK